jgi:oxygen-independent coproporphyrinogen-3 oxidase
MTTHGGLDLIGLGVSSISHLIGVGFWQSEKEVPGYQEVVDAGRLPRTRGIVFSRDDLIRQEVLSQLYCYGIFDPADIGEQFGIDCRTYFEKEYVALHELEEDGLVAFEADGKVRVTFPLGRVLLRNVGAVFDAYLDPDAYKVGDRYYFSVSA